MPCHHAAAARPAPRVCSDSAPILMPEMHMRVDDRHPGYLAHQSSIVLPSATDRSHASTIRCAVMASSSVERGSPPPPAQTSTKWRTSFVIEPWYAVYV